MSLHPCVFNPPYIAACRGALNNFAEPAVPRLQDSLLPLHQIGADVMPDEGSVFSASRLVPDNRGDEIERSTHFGRMVATVRRRSWVVNLFIGDLSRRAKI